MRRQTKLEVTLLLTEAQYFHRAELQTVVHNQAGVDARTSVKSAKYQRRTQETAPDGADNMRPAGVVTRPALRTLKLK